MDREQTGQAGKRARQSGQGQEILVSICALCYNHAPYLRQALDGFLMQEADFGYEILIHDDASTDGSQEIIREYQARYPDLVKPILQSENQHQKGVENIGSVYNYPRAKGKYIALCDCDDYWTDPRKLALQAGYMEAHPDCMLSFHNVRILSGDGALANPDMLRCSHRSRPYSSAELVDKAIGAATGSILLRKEVVQHLPEYYRISPVGDRPMELMAANLGNAYYFDRVMSVYRYHAAGSWSSWMSGREYAAKQEQYYRDMRRVYRMFDKETGGRFHREASHAVRRIRFLTYVNLRDFQGIYRRQNREFLRELSLHDRFFIAFEYRLPGLYRALREAFVRYRQRRQKAGAGAGQADHAAEQAWNV